jgi:hypothetical protein
MRDYHTLADLRVSTLSIECEPCGRRGRYSVARLIEQYGDMKLPELRHVLANCPKAKSQSIHDRCRVRYGEDSPLKHARHLERVIAAPTWWRASPYAAFFSIHSKMLARSITAPSGPVIRKTSSWLRLRSLA